MVARIWSSLTFLVGVKIGKTHVGNNLEIFTKAKLILWDPAILFLGNHQRQMSTYIH